jgi:uncharacterized membrane protein YhaH (DUF805 family)
MSFGSAIQSFFKNYANFKGRARRSEFWFAVLFVGLVGAVISFVFPPQITDLGNGMITAVPSMVSSLWSLAVLIPGLAVVWRRLHDVNLSGGYYFMILIPLVGAILVLIKFATEGTPGPNRFGDPVK